MSTQYEVRSTKYGNLRSLTLPARLRWFAYCVLGTSYCVLGTLAAAQPPDPAVLAAERQRVEVVERVKPAVVAIFSPDFKGGGSGVIIDPDGLALTNFHVVAGATYYFKCGLSDGRVYDAVLVGRDKVGDVALIKLMPRDPGQK